MKEPLIIIGISLLVIIDILFIICCLAINDRDKED